VTEQQSDRFSRIYLKRKTFIYVVFVSLLVVMSWSSFIDRYAKEYVDGTIGQAMAVFVIARGLNAFLTTAKSTELSAGVVSFQPLEVLDPIHDLVEQFSSLMKLSIASLLIQKFLIEIVSTPIFKILLTVVAALFVASIFFRQNRFSKWAWNFLLIVATVRFLFVGLVFLNAIVDEAFSRSETETRKAEVQILAVELERAGRTNIVSEEESIRLGEEVSAFDERLREIEVLRANAETRRLESEARHIEIENQISDIPRNWLWRRDIPEDLMEARDTARLNLRSDEEEVRLLDRDQQVIKEERTQIQKRLDGGDVQGWWDSLLSRFRSVGDLARVSTIKHRADQLIDGILALMALFFMRTVLLPIVFLYLLVRISKMLWKIDPMRALRESSGHARAEILGRPPA